MNSVIQTICSRQSVRQFKNEMISKEDLKLILQCAQVAPSGGNSQLCRFSVLIDPKLIQELVNLVYQLFRKMEVVEGMYKSLTHSILLAKKQEYDFSFHAPVIVIVSNKKSHPNAMADSACALENMMLAAHSLNLGSCWLNQIKWLQEEPEMKAFLQRLDCGEEDLICGSLAIGIPLKDTTRNKLIKGNEIRVF